MMFIGSRHCPHCGTAATQPKDAELSVLKCPRCKIDMASVTIGATPMRECERCGGLWVEVAMFEKICVHREQQSSVLGAASRVPAHPTAEEEKIRYVPCPQCGQLMNRINFARCSGVVVDVCKGHGTWFDRDELREIVEFISGGGLEVSRQKERHEIEFQRQQLHAERIAIQRGGSELTLTYHSDEDRLGGLSAARELLKFLVE